MPQMGVSVSEGTITKWLKQPGETIAQDEPLLEISTDKVDTEVPSPGEGVVTEILVGEGQTVEVGTVLAVIAPAGAAVAEPQPRRAAGPSGSEPERPRPAEPRTPEPASSRAPAAPEPASGPSLPSGARATSDSPAPAPRGGVGQRAHVRLARRRAHRLRARRRPEHDPGHRHGRPGDEEGHPRVHRVRRPGGRRARPRRPPRLLPRPPRRPACAGTRRGRAARSRLLPRPPRHRCSRARWSSR